MTLERAGLNRVVVCGNPGAKLLSYSVPSSFIVGDHFYDVGNVKMEQLQRSNSKIRLPAFLK